MSHRTMRNLAFLLVLISIREVQHCCNQMCMCLGRLAVMQHMLNKIITQSVSGLATATESGSIYFVRCIQICVSVRLDESCPCTNRRSNFTGLSLINLSMYTNKLTGVWETSDHGVHDQIYTRP